MICPIFTAVIGIVGLVGHGMSLLHPDFSIAVHERPLYMYICMYVSMYVESLKQRETCV